MSVTRVVAATIERFPVVHAGIGLPVLASGQLGIRPCDGL